ncbi:MAG: zinc-ribbon domain-containing protein [Lachnospiraceae bacterium]|nr:zinc-ribbon domain-containing protein [Lachnospiraceae bacterium]
MGAFCKNCGAAITPGAKFCKSCGMPVSDENGVNVTPQQAHFTQPAPVNVTIQQEPLTEKTLPDKFKPIGMWQYFWLDVLFAVPIVGFVFLIIFAVGGGGNVNRKYFARSKFCVLILVLIIAAIVVAIAFATGGINYLSRAQYYNSYF